MYILVSNYKMFTTWADKTPSCATILLCKKMSTLRVEYTKYNLKKLTNITKH